MKNTLIKIEEFSAVNIGFIGFRPSAGSVGGLDLFALEDVLREELQVDGPCVKEHAVQLEGPGARRT